MDAERIYEGKVSILVVDDEEGIRRLLRQTLQTVSEYEVYEASDGRAAMTFLEGRPVDIVVTDLKMPGVGGMELMQWSQRRHPEITWIILTGQGTFDDAVRAVHFGAYDFLTKPLGVMDELLVSVRNAVHQRRLTAEREQLYETIEDRNVRLNQQVGQLKEACQLLMQQADTIGQDLHRAELIQRALLPYSVPALHDFAVDTIYRPCHNVGGDLYDIVRLDDRTLVAYIADAAGHGVSAAMLAVLFKHRIPLTWGQPPRPTPPSEALAAVNRCLLTECKKPGLFVTAAYCLLDTVAGEVTIASAGHPPLVLQRADQRIERIHHTGPALGLTREAAFAQQTVRMQPGDRLLMYTDGLCDGQGSRDAFSDGEFGRILTDTRLTSQSLLHALLDSATQQRQQEAQSDDITMLLLTAKAADSTLDNGVPDAEPAEQPLTLGAPAEVLVGSDGDKTTFSIQGRGTWVHCSPIHDACLGELEAGHSLALDLSLCEYLDSTFLGTIQEVVDDAARVETPVQLQGVLPGVHRLFEELGMDRVLSRITSEMTPLPTNMVPLESSRVADNRDRKRILLAHKTLASLSDQNSEEFVRLIEGMRAELARYDAETE